MSFGRFTYVKDGGRLSQPGIPGAGIASLPRGGFLKEYALAPNDKHRMSFLALRVA